MKEDLAGDLVVAACREIQTLVSLVEVHAASYKATVVWYACPPSFIGTHWKNWGKMEKEKNYTSIPLIIASYS